MEANNAEAKTDGTQPGGIFAQTEVETSTETTDTESATEVSTIDEAETSAAEETQAATGDIESSEESTETTETETELYYEIDGDEVSASTVKEWKDGGLRQADYTKKSQANSEIKKTLEIKVVEIDALKERLSQAAETIELSLTSDYNKEDMDYLRDNDPSEFLRKQEEMQVKVTQAQQAKQEVARLGQLADAEKLEVEKQLLSDAIPAWIDPKVREADIALIDAYTKEAGFDESNFNTIQNHRLMVTTLKAAKYDALQKDTIEIAKKVEKAPNVVKASVKQKAPKPKSAKELFYG